MSAGDPSIVVRNTRSEDFEALERLSRAVYPHDQPWTPAYLTSHLRVFPEGQLVAVDTREDRVVGMAASLIVTWDDYEHFDTYNHFTDHGMFTNHDSGGRTLYGAEVMVDPTVRRRGVGGKLYDARRRLAERLGLLRIRAGARLPGYHRYADAMSAEDYVVAVVRGELHDPTLSFQLHRGFHVLAVMEDYFRHDPKSLEYAALIEWVNPAVARPEDTVGRNPRFVAAESSGSLAG